MSEPTVDLARRMPHPWCRDVARDEATRAAEDDASQWRRLELGEVVQEGDEYQVQGTRVWERVPVPCVGKPIDSGHLPHRRRRVPLPDHRDLPQAVAELRERVAALEDHFADASKMVTPSQPAPVPPADGLRTERVTLEITHGEAGQRAFAMVGEMLSRFPVRVVEASNAVDVAGMEYRGNSVGYWYAKAESYRQVVRDCRQNLAAIDGETLAQAAARITAERDAALRERDAAQSEAAGLRNRLEAESAPGLRSLANNLRDKLRDCESALKRTEARVAELEAAAAPAANAGGEGNSEPVAWGVLMTPGSKVWRCSSEKQAQKCVDHFGAGTVVPLYAAPQPPRGWLTSEEREAVENARSYYHAQTCGMNEDGGWYKLHKRRQLACEALLARSMPPRVEGPTGWAYDAHDMAWIAAIREAGGEVGE